MIAKTLAALKTLVMSFDDEEGLPQETYQATYELIEILIGEGSSDIFRALIESSEGRYYFESTPIAIRCWEEISKV